MDAFPQNENRCEQLAASEVGGRCLCMTVCDRLKLRSPDTDDVLSYGLGATRQLVGDAEEQMHVIDTIGDKLEVCVSRH